MSASDNILATLSGQTKAIVLVNEFRLGLQDISALQKTLAGLVSSDLERVGILALVQQQAPLLGLSPEKIMQLVNGLSGEAQPTPALLSATPPAPLPPVIPLAPITPIASAPVAYAPLPAIRPATQSTVPKMKAMPPAGTPIPPAANAEAPPTIKLRQNVDIRSRPKLSPTHTQIIPRADAPPGIAGIQRGDPVLFGGDAVGIGDGIAQRLVSQRVLLADDDARIRMVFRKKLEDSGFVIEEAGTGEEAWKMLQDQEYGIAILDMKMPGLHGLELLARLTAAGGKLPVIVCSAYEQLQEEFVVSTYPKLRYLTKPVDVNKLVATVRELVPAEA